MPSGTLQIHGTDYLLGEDFLAFEGAEGKFVDIIYAGYGIDDENYNDFENIDVEG